MPPRCTGIPAPPPPHHVVIRDEHVIEKHLVGALVPHRPDGVNSDAGLVDRNEEQRDAGVLGVGIGAAATQYHSAKSADVVHVFWPLRIQPPSSRVALSCIDAASEPALGSE